MTKNGQFLSVLRFLHHSSFEDPAVPMSRWKVPNWRTRPFTVVDVPA